MGVVACLANGAARAGDLRIGLAAQPTSLDPLFYVAGSNTEIALNIFDPLVRQDAHQNLVPGLATEWRPIGETTWEFALRPGVTFRDGSPFGAEDVVASLRHVAGIANSPSSFKPYIAGIADIQTVAPNVIRIRTNGPRPLLPNDLSRIAIIPRAMADAPSAAFDTGAIGTGPFRLAHYSPGGSIDLDANPAYWRGAPAWAHAHLRFIANDGARVAALLAGDVDIIDAVPPDVAAAVDMGGNAKLVSAPGNRLIYLHIDSARDVTPFARDAAGQVLPKNPLRDVLVRRAMSESIDRGALVARIMSGQGVPAGQFVPAGYAGYDPDIPVPKFDPADARKLLGEAGFPRGFSLTMHGPNDRYPNDSKLLQAIAQEFSRVGIATEADVQPGSVFFPRASKLEFSVILGGAAVETGEAIGVLNPLLATFDATRGAGTGNRGRWSNAEFDALLGTATQTFDPAARDALLRHAARIATDDVAIIPVLWLAQIWGLRPGIRYTPRTDGYTLAADVSAAP